MVRGAARLHEVVELCALLACRGLAYIGIVGAVKVRAAYSRSRA